MNDVAYWTIAVASGFVGLIVGLVTGLSANWFQTPRYETSGNAILVSIYSVEGDVIETVCAPVEFFVDHGIGFLRASVVYTPQHTVYIRGIGVGRQRRAIEPIEVPKGDTFMRQVNFQLVIKDVEQSGQT